MSILKSAVMLTLQYSCKQSRFENENEFATHRFRKALNFYKLCVAAKGFSLGECVFLVMQVLTSCDEPQICHKRKVVWIPATILDATGQRLLLKHV